jgi:hypothetical protein
MKMIGYMEFEYRMGKGIRKKNWKKGLEGPMKMIGYMEFEYRMGKRIGKKDWMDRRR